MNEWTRELFRAVTLMSGATVALGIAVGLGYWVGHWAEIKWGFEPWGTTAGVFLGLATGFAEIWAVYRRFFKR